VVNQILNLENQMCLNGTMLCKYCGEDRPESAFHMSAGRRRKKCGPCRREQFISNPEGFQQAEERRHAVRRKARRENDHMTVARNVLQDCRYTDKRKNRDCDLTLEFVAECVAKPCFYCGVEPPEVRITLDRIDNSLGHLQNNVNTSCVRCNHTRGTMPYQAWIRVAPMMRAAQDEGLFDGWNGDGPNSRLWREKKLQKE
jgi:hypothetical protein